MGGDSHVEDQGIREYAQSISWQDIRPALS